MCEGSGSSVRQLASFARLRPFSTMTPTATCGDAAGAKHMNHAWGGCPSPCSGVPVLPATVTPEIRATKLKMNVAAPATARRLDHSETVGFTLPSPEGSGITASQPRGRQRGRGVSAPAEWGAEGLGRSPDLEGYRQRRPALRDRRESKAQR
jgi:hypothetical protein